jgi:hypothetical protein
VDAIRAHSPVKIRAPCTRTVKSAKRMSRLAASGTPKGINASRPIKLDVGGDRHDCRQKQQQDRAVSQSEQLRQHRRASQAGNLAQLDGAKCGEALADVHRVTWSSMLEISLR